MKEDVEHGIAQLMLKAEGRQRFKILKIEPQLDGCVHPFFSIESPFFVINDRKNVGTTIENQTHTII